jgi:hypothetical protein
MSRVAKKIKIKRDPGEKTVSSEKKKKSEGKKKAHKNKINY